MDMDFNLQELKLQHEKVAPPAWTPTQEGNTKQHKILTYKENVDDLVIWLDHFKLVCMMENLNQNFWRTKFVEFLQGELLNLFFQWKKKTVNTIRKFAKHFFYVLTIQQKAFIGDFAIHCLIINKVSYNIHHIYRDFSTFGSNLWTLNNLILHSENSLLLAKFLTQ